jgi:hypothetical protein
VTWSEFKKKVQAGWERLMGYEPPSSETLPLLSVNSARATAVLAEAPTEHTGRPAILPAGVKVEVFDSRPETHEHIAQVRGLMLGVVQDLLLRSHRHDRSKLVEPELPYFDHATARLKDLSYGSPEYAAALADMGPGLAHHYEVNDHHPQHFAGGVGEMNILQFLEMICDWIAASRRHADGDIWASIETSQERFGFGDELKGLIVNSIAAIEELEVSTT